jgi:6-phosphogluconolactonase
MRANIRTYATADDLAVALAADLLTAATQCEQAKLPLVLALSGGSTPQRLFRLLAVEPYRTGLPWRTIQLYWGDERCVPPNHPESNYGIAYDELISQITIPADNVHRIQGEAKPKSEAARYADSVCAAMPHNERGLPVFDWILLGLGTDGHTASLFPDDPEVPAAGAVCRVTEHPATGQKRISLSLAVLNSAKRVSFLVTGREKAAIVKTIISTPTDEQTLPAGLVRPTSGNLEWLCDQAAASLL